LAGEYDANGQLIQETVWLGNIPVATLRPAGSGVAVYYIHTDHLNTPRRISRASDNQIVWRWDNDPFGRHTANEDPDGDSQLFTFSLRYPGQYYDEETGLHYNYFRDYDPVTGRYIQSDPIGLAGGLNTYGYANQNPLNFIDPYGLSACPPQELTECQQMCSGRGLAVKSCNAINVLIADVYTCTCDETCPADSYENPGHHDPSNQGPNPYNKTKSTLPENHEELWRNSQAGPDGNRWTKVGSGKKAEYHRFQNDGNDNWHWNGSTNGTTANGTPRPININNVPNEVRKW
jgi:RHS repeat-associated protein